jgi:uncharacterized protein (DUF342 family)
MARLDKSDDRHMSEQLLRRIESLERKVSDLQTRNQKLENIIKQSFMSFKFNKEGENETLIETEEISRMRMIRRILERV